jgi:protein-L-isoaspartate(D-aspartate) O-methyltransferase
MLDALAAAGEPMHPGLRVAMMTVPRHPFTGPPVDPVTGEQASPSGPARLGSWLAAAYTPGYLAGEGQRGQGVGDRGRVWPVEPGGPAWVARVLHAARVTPDCRVLQIGCGTGWQVALLAAWLGGEKIQATDPSPARVELVQARLNELGLSAHLTAAPPELGQAGRRPYDRIIATDPVETIPEAWIRQAGRRAIVVAHLRGALGAGGFAVLRPAKTGNGLNGLSGRFLPWPDPPPDPRSSAPGPRVALARSSRHAATRVDAHRLTHDPVVRLLAQTMLPSGTRAAVRADADGHPATYLAAPDGSWAEIRHAAHPPGGSNARGGGPTPLLPAVDAACVAAAQLGNPTSIADFGITATAKSCSLWHRTPNGPTWPFPGSENDDNNKTCVRPARSSTR